jgi:hypothetical protein
MEPAGGCTVETGATTAVKAAAASATVKSATATVATALGEGELRSEAECQEEKCSAERFPDDRVFHGILLRGTRRTQYGLLVRTRETRF